MFKVGKNITVNADQVLEFRGMNDAGEEIKIGQIKGSIKDNKKGMIQNQQYHSDHSPYYNIDQIDKKIGNSPLQQYGFKKPIYIIRTKSTFFKLR